MLQCRLREVREQKNLSQIEMASLLNISRQAYNHYETGKRKPSTETILELSEIFNVTTDYLLGSSMDSHIPQNKGILRIPIYGVIPAGTPMEAIEDILDYEDAPIEWTTGGREYFGLKLKGDSMFPKYLEDDVVLFLLSPNCDSGQDCAVIINGNEATFKKIYVNEKGLTLQPINHKYEPTFYTNQEVHELPIRILGVSKEIRRRL